MKGFVLGLLVAALAVAAYVYWQRTRAPAPTVSATPDAAASPSAQKGRKHPRGARRGLGPDGPAESEPVHLAPADLRMVAQGDDLSTPDVLRFDMDHDQLPELTQEQIDNVFRAQQPAVLACITRSRPDPETFVPGRVTVKFRIQRAGTVRGVRVEAPAVLHRGGIFGCLKDVLGRLRFPPAGNSQIASYPFSLG